MWVRFWVHERLPRWDVSKRRRQASTATRAQTQSASVDGRYEQPIVLTVYHGTQPRGLGSPIPSEEIAQRWLNTPALRL